MYLCMHVFECICWDVYGSIESLKLGCAVTDDSAHCTKQWKFKNG